jgi:hypothetical protein
MDLKYRTPREKQSNSAAVAPLRPCRYAAPLRGRPTLREGCSKPTTTPTNKLPVCTSIRSATGLHLNNQRNLSKLRIHFKSGLSVYGVICIGRFFMPHVADEDQWWPVEICDLKECERIITVQMFLDLELQDELLRLVRGMPETMNEIQARITVMSI